jgi:hypothetical protein
MCECTGLMWLRFRSSGLTPWTCADSTGLLNCKTSGSFLPWEICVMDRAGCELDSRAIATGSASKQKVLCLQQQTQTDALPTASDPTWCSAYSYRPILLLCPQLQTHPALTTATDLSSCSAYSYRPILLLCLKLQTKPPIQRLTNTDSPLIIKPPRRVPSSTHHSMPLFGIQEDTHYQRTGNITYVPVLPCR